MIRKLLVLPCLVGWLMAAERPNLVLITVDDMNCDSVGAFGCEVAGITPHIDKLAGQGMCFDRGFVTIAICQPTRAVWMTGLYPHRNGALGFDPISRDVPCLPEILGKAGYYNGLVGKAKHVVPTRHAAFDFIRDQKELGHGRDPDEYARAVRTVLEAAKKEGKPFFLMANAHDPHRPFAGSDQEKWRPRPRVAKTYQPDEVPVPAFLPDLPEVRREMAEYYTSVHRADQVVGAILAELDRAGVAGDTLVMFMSDHGMPLPFAKTNCYLHSNRTPWIVRWPGVVKPGTSNDEHFVSGIDVTPTFLDVAGLPDLEIADGRSIAPLLRGWEQKARGRVFTMINRTAGRKEYPMRAVQNDGFLYIWNGWADGKTVFRNESKSGRTMKAMRRAAADDPEIAKRVDRFLHRCTEEMYDLKNDPDCLVNLIEKPNDRWSPRAGAMAKALWHWMKDTADPQRKNFESQVELALD